MLNHVGDGSVQKPSRDLPAQLAVQLRFPPLPPSRPSPVMQKQDEEQKKRPANLIT
jgi:hypothetical protein